jgi:hypothetical protein
MSSIDKMRAGIWIEANHLENGQKLKEEIF